MDLPDAIAHCLAHAGAVETMPFGPDALVYKVGGRMFALTVPDDIPARLNLKCDPDRALLLRDEHPAIIPGYHMNKRHWNTVVLDGSLPSSLVRDLIDHSYALVVASLPKAARSALDAARTSNHGGR
jgi:predicted DNA-binding protein (MmcQ/YjbR family)